MKSAYYVISLDSQSTKAKLLGEDLRAQGIDFSFFNAVDGRKTMPTLQDNERIDLKKKLRYRQSALSSSEVGCYLSHLRLLKEAYAEGLDYVCVLEDDVRLEADFAKVIAELLADPKEYDFVRFMGLRLHKRKILRKLDSVHQLTRPIKGVCGAQGYVMSRTGMEKVIGYGEVIWQPIDKLYDHFWDYDLKSYTIEPHIIWEHNTASSIDKPNGSKKASLTRQLIKQVDKVTRSFQRKMYVLARWTDFYPNQKPSKKVGRTARIH